MRYPGGKGKCFQHVINIFPPHRTYVETHLGGGAVLRYKAPAERSIGIDLDESVIAFWRKRFPSLATYMVANANSFLACQNFEKTDLVYCDPPYLPQTRARANVYRFDYTESDHIQLLTTLRRLPCLVVISGYPSDIYDELLRGWNSVLFPAKTQKGLRTESLWFNYSYPTQLHDGSYIGKTFRERQTVKRRLSRLQRRISGLPPIEKHELSKWLGCHLAQEEDRYGRFLHS
jgi:DNA adenine methylase